uniref:Nucleolar protein 14 n=1 Tax=Lepeophtheirus salmonis TaxID=72036 RepID=A0A0K2TJ27_LEPSM
MVKMTKKKGSDKVSMKKSKKAPSNPFELRFTKEKFKVLGRKPTHPVGKPGVSRAKSIDKRNATLLQEYKRRNKQNAIVDKRIGENDGTMGEEEKMLKRFAMERMKSNGKQSKFNLGDDEEILTHFGQSLAEVERFEDPRSEDEDDDNKKLDSEFVDKMHFGGFMEKADMEFAEGKANSRKEWIESMISDSRKRKMEKQKNLEESVELTMNLDAKWKDMLTTLSDTGFYTKKVKLIEQEENKDSYDMLMRELVFEPKKAKASDRLKTDEEIVKEEKDKLEKLEKDRLARMEGAVEMEDAENEEEDDDEEEVDEEEGTDDGNDSEEEEEEDGFSDLDEDEAEDLKELIKSKKNAKKMPTTTTVEAIQSEIPYVFDVPEEYDQFLTLFEGRYSPSDNETIISRILKCNHPQLSPDNKAKMERLFVFLIQYIHDAVSAYDPCKKVNSFESNALKIIIVITPYLYDIAKFSPQPCAKVVLNLLLEKYEDYCKNTKEYPGLDTIIFLKLAFLLFPSSDFRHPVATPALTFIAHILSSSKVNSRSSVAGGLYLCAIFLECIQLSKRYSPEVANFLLGIIHMSIPKAKNQIIKIVPPFKVVGPESDFLCNKDINKKTESRTLKLSDIMTHDINPEFCISALSVAISLTSDLVDIWSEHASCHEIFVSFAPLLDQLPCSNYPKSINRSINDLKKKIQSVSTKKNPIKEPPKKMEMLKLYEPKVVEDYDPFQKKRSGNKEKLENDKFIHKIKREMKGAKKDIRADSAFLAKQKAKELRQRDEERQRKTKEILSGLGNQEGDYRKIVNSKKKRR